MCCALSDEMLIQVTEYRAVPVRIVDYPLIVAFVDAKEICERFIATCELPDKNVGRLRDLRQVREVASGFGVQQLYPGCSGHDHPDRLLSINVVQSKHRKRV